VCLKGRPKKSHRHITNGRTCERVSTLRVCERVFAKRGCDRGVRGPDRVYILVNGDRCVNGTPVGQWAYKPDTIHRSHIRNTCKQLPAPVWVPTQIPNHCKTFWRENWESSAVMNVYYSCSQSTKQNLQNNKLELRIRENGVLYILKK